MTVIGFLVIAGSAETRVQPRRRTSDYEACGGIALPELPQSNGSCSYSGPVTVAGLVIMLALLALTVWGWWRLAGWALRPLSATAETVRRLGPQNLGQRIGQEGGPDAFKELADALDDALDRLAAGYESQRRFAANASHELRTPLAVQRLLTEVAMEAPEAGDDLLKLGGQLLRTNERNEKPHRGPPRAGRERPGAAGQGPAAAGRTGGHRARRARGTGR